MPTVSKLGRGMLAVLGFVLTWGAVWAAAEWLDIGHQTRAYIMAAYALSWCSMNTWRQNEANRRETTRAEEEEAAFDAVLDAQAMARDHFTRREE